MALEGKNQDWHGGVSSYQETIDYTNKTIEAVRKRLTARRCLGYSKNNFPKSLDVEFKTGVT